MEEMTSRTEEVVKALQKVKESKEKEQNIYEGQLVVVRKKVDDSLDQTLRDAYEYFDLEVDPLEALRTGIKVPHSQLNP